MPPSHSMCAELIITGGGGGPLSPASAEPSGRPPSAFRAVPPFPLAPAPPSVPPSTADVPPVAFLPPEPAPPDPAFPPLELDAPPAPVTPPLAAPPVPFALPPDPMEGFPPLSLASGVP